MTPAMLNPKAHDPHPGADEAEALPLHRDPDRILTFARFHWTGVPHWVPPDILEALRDEGLVEVALDTFDNGHGDLDVMQRWRLTRKGHVRQGRIKARGND
jgi:hypothetical protein